MEEKQGEEFSGGGGEEGMQYELDPQGDDTKGEDQGSVCSTKEVWH